MQTRDFYVGYSHLNAHSSQEQSLNVRFPALVENFGNSRSPSFQKSTFEHQHIQLITIVWHRVSRTALSLLLLIFPIFIKSNQLWTEVGSLAKIKTPEK